MLWRCPRECWSCCPSISNALLARDLKLLCSGLCSSPGEVSTSELSPGSTLRHQITTLSRRTYLDTSPTLLRHYTYPDTPTSLRHHSVNRHTTDTRSDTPTPVETPVSGHSVKSHLDSGTPRPVSSHLDSPPRPVSSSVNGVKTKPTL